MTIGIEPRKVSLRQRASKRSAAAPAVPTTPPATPEPPRIPGRRNPKWIALGIVALCLGGLLSYMIYARVTTETPVVSVAQTVYRGEVIETSDLTTITLQGSTIPQAVPASDLATVVGRRAGTDLVAGSVLVASAVTDETIPATGRAVVGLKLSAGRTPTSLLLPSSAVRLIALAPENGSDKLTGDAFTARVIDQSNGADGTSILVNVDVAADQAATIAQLAAQDRIALVRDAGR